MDIRLSRFEAVLFDLDGTLIEFKFRIRESRQAMFDFVHSLGYDISRMNDHMKTQDVIDETRYQWERSTGKQTTEFDAIKDDLFKILDSYESEVANGSRPFADSLEVVRSVSVRLPTGLVTNSGRPAVETILKKHGFAPFLSAVVTRNEMPRLKPSPAGLLAALKQLGVKPEKSLYVGDSTLDIEAAKLAKMKCAAVSTGLYGENVLRNLEPDFMLNKLGNLNEII